MTDKNVCPTGFSSPARPQRHRPRRDQDDLFTYRFMASEDGGENWSEFRGTGDTGMWWITNNDTVSAWSFASLDFGSLVDLDNNLHCIAVLNAFDPNLNPLGRANGVYDIRSDISGENVSHNLIAEDTSASFTWSDCGMDQEGNLVAIWVNADEFDQSSEIWASCSEDGGDSWSDPVRLARSLDLSPYPHITPHIGGYFYVIYQMANENSGLYDHRVLRVPAGLDGQVTALDPGVASVSYLTYYVGAVSPIDQDVEAGYLYFCVRNEDLSGTTVAHSDNEGEDWVIETINGPQRYPGIGLDVADGVPWVFNNNGEPAHDSYQQDWYSYDELGYNGGSWTARTMNDSMFFDGTRDLLYCHQGVWTTEGRLVTGCNVWGSFTPEGFVVNYTDDDGGSWNGMTRLWSIFDEEGLEGGSTSQCQLVAGQDNTVWMVLCGRYGDTDFTGPDITTIDVSSVELGEPKVVSVEITDDSGVSFASFNWKKEADGYDWEFAESDSSNVDGFGNGIYYFHLPDSCLLDGFDPQPLENGDVVYFQSDASDQMGNFRQEYEGGNANVWIVGDYWSPPNRDGAVVYGRVTNAKDSSALKGAAVRTQHGFSTLTDANGDYVINDVLADIPLDLTVSYGGNDFTYTDLMVAAGDSLEVNFELWLPEFTPSTRSLSAMVDSGSAVNLPFDATNGGQVPLKWALERKLPRGADMDPWELRLSYDVGQEVGDSRIEGVAFGNGKMYVSGGGGGEDNSLNYIYVFDRDMTLVDQFVQPDATGNYGMTDLDWDGELIWGGFKDTLYGIDPSGVVLTSFGVDRAIKPIQAVAWDPDRQILWVAKITGRDIYGYDRLGQQVATIPQSGINIFGLAYWPEDPDHHQLYAFNSLATQIVTKINPENGDTIYVGTLNPEGGGSPRGATITNQYDVYSWVFLAVSNAGADDRVDVWQLDARLDWFQVGMEINHDWFPAERGVIDAGATQNFLLNLNSADLLCLHYDASLIFRHNALGGSDTIEVALDVTRPDVVRQDSPLPLEFTLQPVYPNPFNGIATIQYALPAAGEARLAIYDVQGRLVETLRSGVAQAGYHTTVWNAADCGAGVYIIRLESQQKTLTAKAVLVK